MKKIFLFPLILLFLSGCDLVEDTRRPEVTDIESRIIISPVINFYTYGENKLFLVLKTEKYYPCANYTLISYPKKYDKALDIYIRGAEAPEICITAFGPAVMHMDLENFYGEYELTIRSKDFSDKYKLTVREDFAFIEGDSTAHTKPVNTMWIR